MPRDAKKHGGKSHGSHSHSHGHGHGPHFVDFKDVGEWVERFEAPERATWQKPAEVIASLNIARGDRVADIGAGTGYFTLAMGRAVGEEGVAYAVDAEPGMIQHLKQRVVREHAPMIQTVLAKDGELSLPEPVDLIFVCNVLHHVENRPPFLKRMKSQLRPNGRAVIVDWHKRSLPCGPPKEMKIGAAEAVDEMREAGFVFVERRTFLPYQYFLVFR